MRDNAIRLGVMAFGQSAVLSTLLFLAACDTTTTAKTLAATGVALTAADTTAMQYVTLPLCPAGATQMPDHTLCSQAAISAQIKSAAQTAYNAYQAAQANPTSATLATVAAAISALTSLVPVATPAS